MSTRKSILVGVDYSPPSINALHEAARLANAGDLPLVCYHVLNEEVLADFKHHESFDREGILEFAEEKLASFIREVIGTGHEIEACVTIGNPFAETLKHIEAHNAETLVLGSRGFGSDEHHTVGPLASRCVRKAAVDVLLIRSAQEAPFHTIAACVDFSENSFRAVHRAAEIARQYQAELRLIYIYRPPIYADSEIGWLGPAFPMIQEPSVEANSQSRLEKLGYDIGLEYDLQNISTVVRRSSSVTRGIREALREMDAELVVLGTRGRTGFKSLLLGTVAEGLIHSTPCSVLTIKPEGFV